MEPRQLVNKWVAYFNSADADAIAEFYAKAYAQLRSLNAKYGYGNNYLLTILLENFEEIADSAAVENVFAEFAAQYGAPAGTMSGKK